MDDEQKAADRLFQFTQTTNNQSAELTDGLLEESRPDLSAISSRADIVNEVTSQPYQSASVAISEPSIPRYEVPSPSVTRQQGSLIIALLAIGLLAGLALAAWVLFLRPVPPPPVVQWEYRLVNYLAEGNDRTGSEALRYSSVKVDNEELKELGVEGWELVGSYLEMETAFPNFGDPDYVTGLQPNIRPQQLVLIFKRQFKPSEAQGSQ